MMRKIIYHSLTPMFTCLAKSKEVMEIRERLGKLHPLELLPELQRLKKLDSRILVALSLCLYDDDASLESNLEPFTHKDLRSRLTILQSVFNTMKDHADVVLSITHIMENPYVNIYDQLTEGGRDLLTASLHHAPVFRGNEDYYHLLDHLIAHAPNLNRCYKNPKSRSDAPPTPLDLKVLFTCDISIVKLFMKHGMDFSQHITPRPIVIDRKLADAFWRDFMALKLLNNNIEQVGARSPRVRL